MGNETRRDAFVCRALREADQLLDSGRGGEAATLAGQVLGRAHADQDLVARLLLVRAEGFAQCGRVTEMDRAIQRARGAARGDITRARVAECYGLIAWRSLRLSDALQHLGQAESLFFSSGLMSGVVRTLGHMAGVRADFGTLNEARMLAARRLELACRSDSLRVIAQAKADLAALLLSIGRWRDVAREVGDPISGDAFPLEMRRAGLDLAAGRPLEALARLEKGMNGNALPGALRAEALLVLSDAALAAGDAARAERAAGESIAFRVRRGEAGGECRARMRRAHALIGLGRAPEAVAEAKRAAAIVPHEARGLSVVASATLGRALLRRNPEGAERAFRVALISAPDRTDIACASAIGAAVAGGAEGWRDEVEGRVESLREWGDARLLALVAQDLRRHPPQSVVCCRPGMTARDGAFLDAARSFRASASVELRWVHALAGIRSVLPWSRAWLVGGEHVLECQPNGLSPCEGISPAAQIARECQPPCVVAEQGGMRHVVIALGPQVRVGFEIAPGTTVGDSDLLSAALAFGAMAVGLAPETLDVLPRPVPPPRIWKDQLVGRSRGLRALLEEIDRVAQRTDLSVHIYGETGTGKERVARALHERSDRAGKPFVAVNVACLSDELFQSEVFGHVRGAFTHAVADRDGFVSRAEGGTLFLDEVADLSGLAQVKLLRFLQERDYERVGEARVRKANVRIVTASNADLDERVRERRFRQDLFYRLAHWIIRIPPLRDREGDVRVLAEHFLAGSASAGQPRGRFSSHALSRLEAHDWPGNVRELQSVVEKLVVSCGGGLISGEAVDAILPNLARRRPKAAGLHAALSVYERDVVKDTLEQNGGHRTRTAASLGISRQALSVKMRQLGL